MIQVIHRAVAILEYLAETPSQARRLKDIAGCMRLNAATCANILKTLLKRGLAAKNGAGYQLGPWIDHMGQKSPYRQGLAQLAEPEIVRLAHAVGETALLAVIQQGRRYVMCHADGNRAMQMRPDFLFRKNVYQSASGRLLLACQPADAIKAIIDQEGLPRKNWPNIATETQLLRALQKIRRQGFVVRQDQEFAQIVRQIRGIAWPVRQGDTVVAAVAMMVPAMRFQGAERGRLIRTVRDAADRISRAATSLTGGSIPRATQNIQRP